jgi:1,6-anhydro-N-acetylmuramate kinase
MLTAGLMSGTSADGIDVAIAEITGLPNPYGDGVRIAQRAFATVPWPPTEPGRGGRQTFAALTFAWLRSLPTPCNRSLPLPVSHRQALI